MRYEFLCGSCVHFRKRDSHGGKCHRYPPISVPSISQDSDGNFIIQIKHDLPFVKEKDFCGEYQQQLLPLLTELF